MLVPGSLGKGPDRRSSGYGMLAAWLGRRLRYPGGFRFSLWKGGVRMPGNHSDWRANATRLAIRTLGTPLWSGTPLDHGQPLSHGEPIDTLTPGTVLSLADGHTIAAPGEHQA